MTTASAASARRTQPPSAPGERGWRRRICRPERQRLSVPSPRIRPSENAYLALAETRFYPGDRAGAAEILDRARSRANLFTDYDRARVDLLTSEFSGNLAMRRTALRALSRLSTTDSGILESLGNLEYNGRRFQAAAEAFRSALALNPENGQIANMLGYAEALRGNLDSAVEAMERYARIAPQDPNPSDSLGDVYFFAGRFDEAEKAYQEANQKQPQHDGMELLKAAQAKLMTGDVPAADGLFQRYTAVRRAARDPLVDVQTARWRYLEGRQKEAIASLENIAKGPPSEYTTYAHVQLAIWYLVAGQTVRRRITRRPLCSRLRVRPPGPSASSPVSWRNRSPIPRSG